MKIVNSTIDDIDTIFDLYDEASKYQVEVFMQQWVGFERVLIETEIEENRQWKILINNEIACVFAVTYNDEIIWKEKDQQPSIYIHRISVNNKFRGRGFVNIIVSWATVYCKTHQKKFIRMDTLGHNQKLIDYYIKCGFKHTETIKIDALQGMPAHYKGSLALFEIAI
ncbi:MAG: GNAT family N-acetyltransferase [Lutibacter sp.]|nr:MAG: GNAT family N-acetyltransferase [Lutibacter sp.]